MLEAVCAGSASAEARLDLFEIVAYDGAIARVRPRTPDQAGRVRSLESWIGERVSQAIGRPVRIAVEGDAAPPAGPSAPEREAARAASRAAAAHSDPLVRLALDLFDGRIVDME